MSERANVGKRQAGLPAGGRGLMEERWEGGADSLSRGGGVFPAFLVPQFSDFPAAAATFAGVRAALGHFLPLWPSHTGLGCLH